MMTAKRRSRPTGNAAKKTSKAAASKKRTVSHAKKGVQQQSKLLKAQHRKELEAEKTKARGIQQALKSVHQAITKALKKGTTTTGTKRHGRRK